MGDTPIHEAIDVVEAEMVPVEDDQTRWTRAIEWAWGERPGTVEASGAPARASDSPIDAIQGSLRSPINQMGLWDASIDRQASPLRQPNREGASSRRSRVQNGVNLTDYGNWSNGICAGRGSPDPAHIIPDMS